MSTPSHRRLADFARRLARLTGAAAFLLVTTTGCWEQWSETWFPQMKWQKSIQGYEPVEFEGRKQGFRAPEGSVSLDGAIPEIGRMDLAATAALENPTDPSDYRSIERGEELYDTYCAACHGAGGLGDGPVSSAGEIRGPFGGVYPLVGLVSGRTDGYIWNVISIGNGGMPGFRMPSYRRIRTEDRWHIVNYVRFLDSKGGRP